MASKHNLTIIRSFLQTHNPTDPSECESLRRIMTLVSSAREPFARDEYQPGHLTASAFVVSPDHAKTMLIFHEKLERWLQPGGHFEPGECDPSVASAREVLEETALVTSVPESGPHMLDVDVHEIPARKTEPRHCHFDLRMLLIADPTQGEAGDGVTEARWFDAAELAELELDPGLQRALRKVGLIPRL